MLFGTLQRMILKGLLKLTRLHINHRRIYFNINTYLFVHVPTETVMLDFIWFHRPVRSEKLANNSKWKYMHQPGIEPVTSCFQACRSYNSAIGPVNDKLLNFLHLHYLFKLPSITKCFNACMKLLFDMYWNWLSDKICISFTNIDVTVIYNCLHKFVGTNQTIRNLILALSHTLIDSSVQIV